MANTQNRGRYFVPNNQAVRGIHFAAAHSSPVPVTSGITVGPWHIVPVGEKECVSCRAKNKAALEDLCPGMPPVFSF